jgi:hypothetical protein
MSAVMHLGRQKPREGQPEQPSVGVRLVMSVMPVMPVHRSVGGMMPAVPAVALRERYHRHTQQTDPGQEAQRSHRNLPGIARAGAPQQVGPAEALAGQPKK